MNVCELARIQGRCEHKISTAQDQCKTLKYIDIYTHIHMYIYVIYLYVYIYIETYVHIFQLMQETVNNEY